MSLLAAGCGSSETPASRMRAQPVPQLRSIEQLRTTFNAHANIPRLIVLIAPT